MWTEVPPLKAESFLSHMNVKGLLPEATAQVMLILSPTSRFFGITRGRTLGGTETLQMHILCFSTAFMQKTGQTSIRFAEARRGKLTGVGKRLVGCRELEQSNKCVSELESCTQCFHVGGPQTLRLPYVKPISSDKAMAGVVETQRSL